MSTDKYLPNAKEKTGQGQKLFWKQGRACLAKAAISWIGVRDFINKVRRGSLNTSGGQEEYVLQLLVKPRETWDLLVPSESRTICQPVPGTYSCRWALWNFQASVPVSVAHIRENPSFLLNQNAFSFKSIFKHKPSPVTFSLHLSLLRFSLSCLQVPPSFCSTFSSGSMLLFALISHPFHPSVAGNVRASAVMSRAIGVVVFPFAKCNFSKIESK